MIERKYFCVVLLTVIMFVFTCGMQMMYIHPPFFVSVNLNVDYMNCTQYLSHYTGNLKQFTLVCSIYYEPFFPFTVVSRQEKKLMLN
jgi:hypothetical protein